MAADTEWITFHYPQCPNLWSQPSPDKSQTALSYNVHSGSKVTTTYISNPDYQGTAYEVTYCISGSFCPPKTGEYTITNNGKSWIGMKFWTHPAQEKGGYCDGGNNTLTQGPDHLQEGHCYPYFGCAFTRSFACWAGPGKLSMWYTYASKPGEKAGPVTKMTPMDVVQCQKDDCRYGLAGKQCDVKVDLDTICGPYGWIRMGSTSDGIGCNCTKNWENPFCEDPNFGFTPGEQGIAVTVTPPLDNPVTQTYSAFQNLGFDEIYSTITITTFLFLPQNSDLEFKLDSSPSAQILINGKSYGNPQNALFCQRNSASTVSVPKQHFTRGLYNITIKYNSGCAVNDQRIGKLQWKYYMWHRNDPNTPFEDIPTRYYTKLDSVSAKKRVTALQNQQITG